MEMQAAFLRPQIVLSCQFYSVLRYWGRHTLHELGEAFEAAKGKRRRHPLIRGSRMARLMGKGVRVAADKL